MARPLRRFALWSTGALVLAIASAGAASTGCFASLGGKPDARERARMKASPMWQGDHFENAEPTGELKVGPLTALHDLMNASPDRAPKCPLPLFANPAAALAQPPASGLRITWLGHSTTLVELDGVRVLTDPQWSERASPSSWVGPERFHPPPLPLDALPHLDAVVVSHDHYDHLDMETVRALAKTGVAFHVALGVGAHLRAWGVPEAQIVEHAWWDEAKLPGGVRLVSTPARHFSGRFLKRNSTLWTSWSLVGPQHRVFFSGDTGLTQDFAGIAQKLGPFDVALLEIGQYHPSWGDIHLGPDGALTACGALGARRLLPIHWATFALGYHAWSEPAETLFTHAAERGVPLVTPLLGEPVEPTRDAPANPWWRALPPIAPRCP